MSTKVSRRSVTQKQAHLSVSQGPLQVVGLPLETGCVLSSRKKRQVGGDITQVPSVAALLTDKSPHVQGSCREVARARTVGL